MCSLSTIVRTDREREEDVNALMADAYIATAAGAAACGRTARDLRPLPRVNTRAACLPALPSFIQLRSPPSPKVVNTVNHLDPTVTAN